MMETQCVAKLVNGESAELLRSISIGVVLIQLNSGGLFDTSRTAGIGRTPVPLSIPVVSAKDIDSIGQAAVDEG